MTNTPLLTSSPASGNNSANDFINLLSKIMSYFTSRGFQAGLVSSFLEGEGHLDVKTDAELMFDFLEERKRLNPTIFIGIEGSGVSGVKSGEDKRLLIEWVLQKKSQMNSVIVCVMV